MDPIITRVGWAGFGDYAHFGRRIYRDLLGKTSYLGLVAFATTGRHLSPAETGALDDIALCMHIPEPRIWPAKLARVVASHGNFISGLIAGCGVLESDVIGAYVATDAATMLVALRRRIDAEGDTDEVVTAFVKELTRTPGLGAVHARPVDERVVALQSALLARDRTGLPFWQLAERLWAAAEKSGRGQANIFGAVAAALLNLAFHPRDVAPLVTVFFQPSFLAHAVEGAAQQAPQLRQLSSEAVRYVGPPPRESPRSIVSKGA